MKKISVKLRNDLNDVIQEFPELEVFKDNGKPYKLEGPIDIIDIDGNNRGTYEIQILFNPEKHPYDFPSLREISNKIPKEKDRHIYENTGNCCVAVLQEQVIETKKGISIYNFVKKYAVPYLANQIYFEENGKWANGDYFHGDAGQIQYYVEAFKTVDLEIIITGINKVISRRMPGRNDLCFCNGGLKFKRCHQPILEKIEQLGETQLKADIEKIITLKNLKQDE